MSITLNTQELGKHILLLAPGRRARAARIAGQLVRYRSNPLIEAHAQFRHGHPAYRGFWAYVLLRVRDRLAEIQERNQHDAVNERVIANEERRRASAKAEVTARHKEARLAREAANV